MTKHIEGFRKLGIAGSAIIGLLWKSPSDIRIAIIVGIIAVVGIVSQAVLDFKQSDKQKKGTEK